MRNLFESLLPRTEPHWVPVLLDDYLDHLCAPLIDRMTYEQRLAIREEVRSHVLVLAAGHEELGSSPEEALKAAMQQFGDARKIGRSLLKEYRLPFTLHTPLFWYLLHGAIGGVVGAISFVTMDAMLQHKNLVSQTTLIPDCLCGFALGFLPGVHLWRRPASPLKAA
ncbi:MAG: hypothetical protein JWN14_419 [Chthonomonadales bacterium]|nr:hypothetical protein [Chthonomonadales bacterium]